MTIEIIDARQHDNEVQCADRVHDELNHISKIHAPYLTVGCQIVLSLPLTPGNIREEKRKLRWVKKKANQLAPDRVKVVIVIQTYAIRLEATTI